MSCSYAEGLSPYENKGKLGLPEKWDEACDVREKVTQLAQWITESRHVVFHTGAGVSTAAGIPDFRGPRGVWTLERKGLKPESSLDWNDARPTKTHRAIAALVDHDLVKFVITQNIDGLHMRSGLPRRLLAELHGNMFVDQCNVCRRQFVRSTASSTVGQKVSSAGCPGPQKSKARRSRPCRGRLADFVLDWEDELPEADLVLSDAHSVMADLSIVLGSTLQIVPSGNLPTYAKKYHGNRGRLVIVNLQPTKHDRKADLLIHDYVDNVMEELCHQLKVTIPPYNPTADPVVQVADRERNAEIEWTQDSVEAQTAKKLADFVERDWRQRRKESKQQVEADLKQINHHDVVNRLCHLQNEAPAKDNDVIKRPIKDEDDQTPAKVAKVLNGEAKDPDAIVGDDMAEAGTGRTSDCSLNDNEVIKHENVLLL